MLIAFLEEVLPSYKSILFLPRKFGFNVFVGDTRNSHHRVVNLAGVRLGILAGLLFTL